MKKIFITIAAAGAMFFTSCSDSLNTLPIDNNIAVADKVYLDFENYEKVLAKVYAGLAVSGQDGNSDISGIDGGFGQFIRGYFNLQELPTEEAICNWNDQTIKDMHNLSWSSSDVYITAMYNRIFYTASVANEFLRQTTDEKVAERGMSAHAKEITRMRNEARWVRAYIYWVGIDLFGSIPFVDETGQIGTSSDMAPKQKSRQEIFTWIETELKSIENELPAAGDASYYGRATQGAAWALLARLYLNAEVYTGTPRWADVITYCDKVIGANYSLVQNYSHMFLADNGVTSKSEFIFSIVIDGLYSQSFGATTYLICAATGGKMNKAEMGLADWGGIRATKQFAEKFTTGDRRNLLFTDGQSPEIPTNNNFTEGYGVQKYRNLTSTGAKGSDGSFSDVDLPLFRLADVYLMYAEAHKRGSVGDASLALNYVNRVRARAWGNDSGNVSDYDLNFILDERARELYWECVRRTDLVRFGMFTSDEYIWQWKGGVVQGRGVADYYQIYPLAASDVAANPNLKQNPGY